MITFNANFTGHCSACGKDHITPGDDIVFYIGPERGRWAKASCVAAQKITQSSFKPKPYSPDAKVTSNGKTVLRSRAPRELSLCSVCGKDHIKRGDAIVYARGPGSDFAGLGCYEGWLDLKRELEVPPVPEETI